MSSRRTTEEARKDGVPIETASRALATADGFQPPSRVSVAMRSRSLRTTRS